MMEVGNRGGDLKFDSLGYSTYENAVMGACFPTLAHALCCARGVLLYIRYFVQYREE